MKKITALLISLSLATGVTFAQTTLIASGRAIITFPADLINISPEKNNHAEWAARNGKATLSYTHETNSVDDNDIPAFADDQLKLAKQDDESFTYLDDGIHLQDGKNIGYLKFSAKEGNKKFFNYIFFISIDKKPLVFKFSCPLKEQKKWEAAADKIANSLRVVP